MIKIHEHTHFPSILDLPVDILYIILSSIKDHLVIIRLTQVSKYYHQIFNHAHQVEALWRNYIQQDFPTYELPTSVTNHRELYKREFIRRISSLPTKHKRLFEWVRTDQLSAIKQNTYRFDRNNDAIFDKAIEPQATLHREDPLRIFYCNLEESFAYC